MITRDGNDHQHAPARFLMQPYQDTSAVFPTDPDAIDFTSFLPRQNLNLRVLSALRMNATFPQKLPNVWLPSDPVIDVMDAGLRDNFGHLGTSSEVYQSFQRLDEA